MKAVGDKLLFVLPAYIFVFGIWTAASSYDFISGKWQTVGSARRRGMRHLCAIILPMVYMLVYIKFQADADDAKEVSTGILALLFACAEFCRTVVGLWQLHVFRHWVAASIRSLESLGYVAEKRIENGGAEGDRDGKPHSQKHGDEDGNNDGDSDLEAAPKRELSCDERRNSLEIADNLIINDLIVDNTLSEGEVEVILRVRSSGRRKSWAKRAHDFARWFSCIWHFPRLVFAICRSREPRFSSPTAPIHLEPYDAEDVYMRWACVLIAQVFPKWLSDMQQSGMSDLSSENKLSEQLSRFRRGLLVSAALHTQSRIKEDVFDGSQGSTGDASGHVLFDLAVWHKYPKLCKGVFSMQEFLRVAGENGGGLPFGAPHRMARSGEDNSEFSYSRFKSKLNRIRERFRVNDVEKLKELETSHLEWLAVFLSIPDWRPKPSRTVSSMQEDQGLRNSPFDSTRLAMDNLCSQLGLSSPTTAGSSPFHSTFLTSFPLFYSSLYRTFERNRNTLEVSLHIDNTLALMSGAQFQFMTDKKKDTAKRIQDALSSIGLSGMKDLYSSAEKSGEYISISEGDVFHSVAEPLGDETIFLEDFAASGATVISDDASHETERLLYQLVSDDADFALLGQRTTFLGANMERLRSALALWVEENPDAPESVWFPAIENAERRSNELFSFQASDCLAKVLDVNDGFESIGNTCSQTRLLWELQNFFLSLIPERGLCPERHEAIILCLLSFPALTLRVFESKEGERMIARSTPERVSIAITKNTREVNVALAVSLEPQPFHISVRLEVLPNKDVEVTASLSGEGTFCWEVWRNSFTSRLEGVRQWQEKNGLAWAPVVQTESSITRGIRSAKLIAFGTGNEMKIWLGWLPHRPSTCMFEVESPGFIMQMKQETLDLKFSRLWGTVQSTGLTKARHVPVKYANASRLDIEHASMVAHKILLQLSGKGKQGVDSFSFDGKAALVDEMQLTRAGDTEKEFQLRLSESVAVHHQYFQVLERVALSLCKKESGPDRFVRAASMIERFCSIVGEKKNAFEVGSPGLRMQDEGMLLKVLSLVKKLGNERSVNCHSMLQSFSRICTSFANCDVRENVRIAAAHLLRSIISDSHMLSETGMRELCKDLGSLLGRIGSEHDPLSLLLFTRFSKHGELKWFSNGLDALRGTSNSLLSPSLAVILFSIGAVEQKDSKCMSRLGAMYDHGYQNNRPEPFRAAELYTRAIQEGGDLNATYNLAILLGRGAQGVDANPARAVELYNHAICEGKDTDAMINLANLLERGARGVGANPARACKLYMRALEETVDIDAMHSLALLLQNGANGVDADPARAIELYSRAIEEGNHVNSMNDLARLLVQGAEGVDANPARAVELFNGAIEGGNVVAMYNLANLLAEGANGVQADPVRAVQLYSRAIAEGVNVDAIASAMNGLAALLEDGIEAVDADLVRVLR